METKNSHENGDKNSPTVLTTAEIDSLNVLSGHQFGKDNQKSLQLALQALQASRQIKYNKGEANALLQAGMCQSSLGDYSSALVHYNNALILYQTLNDIQGKATVYSKTGNALLFQGKYADALEKYNLALELKSTFNDTLGIADLHTNSAIIYGLLGYHAKALGLHLEALKKFESINDKARMASSFSNIGLIYEEQQNYAEAVKMYQQALHIRQELNDAKGISGILINMGNIDREQKDFDGALRNYRDALTMAQTAKDDVHIALSYINLGDTYKDLQQHNMALDFNHKALAMMERLNDKRGIVQIKVNLGEVYFDLQQYDIAGKYLNEGIKLSEETGLKSQNRRALKGMTNLLEKEGHFEKAFYSLRSFIRLDSELMNAETSNKIANMQFSQQIERKEREAEIERLKNVELKQALEKLQQEKIRSELLFQNQLQELKSSALQAQMNPHFVFNSLNSIEQYIWAKDPEEATAYLKRFSKLIRMILHNSQRQFISLEEELSALQYYIDLESLRFENKFEYRITCDGSINQKEVQLPSMIIQPFVENAILHGLQPLKIPARLSVVITRKINDILHISIEDNGVGRIKARQNKIGSAKTHQSVAIKLTHERLRKMNTGKESDQAIIINDLYHEDGQPAGTRVDIQIPVEFGL